LRLPPQGGYQSLGVEEEVECSGDVGGEDVGGLECGDGQALSAEHSDPRSGSGQHLGIVSPVSHGDGVGRAKSAHKVNLLLRFLARRQPMQLNVELAGG